MSDAPSSPMEMIDDRKIVGIMQSGVSFKSKEDQKKKKKKPDVKENPCSFSPYIKDIMQSNLQCSDEGVWTD